LERNVYAEVVSFDTLHHEEMSAQMVEEIGLKNTVIGKEQ